MFIKTSVSNGTANQRAAANRRYAIQFMSQGFYNTTSFGGR
jgi:hypothetical protein